MVADSTAARSAVQARAAHVVHVRVPRNTGHGSAALLLALIWSQEKTPDNLKYLGIALGIGTTTAQRWRQGLVEAGLVERRDGYSNHWVWWGTLANGMVLLWSLTLVRAAYGRASNDVRNAALQGMMISGYDEGLIEIFHASDDTEEKRLLLHMLMSMESDAALEIIDATLAGEQ